MRGRKKLAIGMTERPIAALGLISALVAASVFAAPARAASLPSGGVVSVTVTGPTSATVVGSVNPGGLTTSYAVVYDLASSRWCRTNGASGQPANSGGGGATGTRPHIFVISLWSLTPGSAYCVAIRATNSLGTVSGPPYQRFTAGAPDARAYSPTSTSSTTATLYGGVDPAGQTTTYQVRYGLASSTWCSSNGTSGTPTYATKPQTLSYTDGTLHSVWVSMAGLTSGTSYCATITATDATTSTSGSIIGFTLDHPGVLNNNAAATGATTATINGAVNAFGQTNLYYGVVYDLANSTWCASNGSVPDATTTNAVGMYSFPYTDSTFHPVSVGLTALTPGTQYCATIGAGTAQAVPIYFITAAS